MSSPSESSSLDPGDVHDVPTAGRLIHWARFYDLGAWLLTLGGEKRMRRRMVRLARIKPGDHLLDIGCGTGSFALAAKAAAGEAGVVYGIDPSGEMISIARRKAGRRRADVHFESGAAEKLRFGEGEFDIVSSSLVLHHLPAELKAKAFAEFFRVLEPGGRFFAIDLRPGRHGPLGHLFALHSHAGDDNTSALLAAAGFTGVESAPAGFRGLDLWRASKPQPAAEAS